MRTKEQQSLVDYLKLRWKHLQGCEGYVISKMQDDEKEWVERVNAGKVSSIVASKALNESEWIVGHTFRYIMLTAICTFVEETSRKFASHEFADYEARAKKKQGSNFARYMKVVEDSPRFDATGIKDAMTTLIAAGTLRNYIVHAWGRVNSSELAKVKKAAASIEGARVIKGVVHLDNIADVILAAEDIGNALIDQLFPWKTRGKSS